MGTSNEHGQLFDRFPAMPNPPHGGSLYDEGFDLQRLEDDHGERFDRFAKPNAPGLHGERFDEFGWRDMPMTHGWTFDTDFNEPTAHDGSDGHATWFDAFRGGAQVRYRSEGADYEGTVIDLNRDYATVERPDGARQEIGVQQVMQWREASAAATLGDNKPKPTAHPGETDTSVVGGPQGERPSGESHHAMGGGERTAVDPDAPFASTAMNKAARDAGIDVAKLAMISHVCSTPGCGHGFTHRDGGYVHPDKGKTSSCPGCHADLGKTSPHALAAMSTDDWKHLSLAKTAAEWIVDVVKRGRLGPLVGHVVNHSNKPPTYHCKGCGVPESRRSATPLYHNVDASCDTCGNKLSSKTAFGKSVDSTETAVESQDLEGKPAQAGKAWCSKCKHFCTKASNGKCPTCGGKVSVRKTAEELADVTKQLRETAGLS